MSCILHLNQVVQVSRVRGKGYATVNLINADGSTRKRDKSSVVHFPEDVRGVAINGSLWRLSGKERITRFEVNDVVITEYTIYPKSLNYLRPSGRILARWLSANIAGIGGVIANRLVRFEGLNEAVKERDRSALSGVAGMSEQRIDRLIDGWPDDELHEVIEWLERQQLPLGLGEKLVKIFGESCIDRVRAHPFLLMSMGVPYEKTMQVAMQFGLSRSDDCVLAGIAQYVAIENANQTGSTVISKEDLLNGSARVVDSDPPKNIGVIGCEHGVLAEVPGGYQVFGTALMEVAVAQFLTKALSRRAGEEARLAAWERVVTGESVDAALISHENALDFKLTNDQRTAIKGSVASPVCGISGGAGTGKTTILKAILDVYEQIASGIACYQVALSGRAAQRMSETTGRPAQTIAKFIIEHTGAKARKLPGHLLLVIDEASMIDLLSMYRLVNMLPLASRLLFVGDVAQLPPVGPGLIFHALTDSSIPFYHLSQVQRQDELGCIHRFATSIREGFSEIPPKTSTLLINSPDCAIERGDNLPRLVELWKEAGGVASCVILSPVRKGHLGVLNINRELQSANGHERVAVHYEDHLRDWIPFVTSSGVRLLVGDPVLVTANNYVEDAELRNGDLGVILEAFDRPESDGALGALEIGGSIVRITVGLLEKLDLGYAVTIHKAQGSQWPVCFVMLPQEAMRMVDQSLIYTAATRAQKRLVLMGDPALIDAAIGKGFAAEKRKTCLRERLSVGLQQENVVCS